VNGVQWGVGKMGLPSFFMSISAVKKKKKTGLITEGKD